jgi:hypothetical protein
LFWSCLKKAALSTDTAEKAKRHTRREAAPQSHGAHRVSRAAELQGATRIMNLSTTLRHLVAASLLAGILGACGGGGEAADQPRPISAGTIQKGAVVPLPQTEAVLAIRGEGLRTNTGDAVAFDLPTLEALPTVEVAIEDPWEKRQVVYRGVLMSELLAVVGAPVTATEVKFTALDAYEITLSADELRSGHVVLATRANGELMAVKNGGPSRIVFLPPSEQGKNKDLWIWSIKDMVVQ